MIRPATAADVPDLVRLIRQLADFQGHLEDAVLTEADLSSALFPRDDSAPVHAHVAEADDRVVGMAIWFTSFSTWTGRRGIWLEDLFIEEAYRGRGLGVGLMTALARECARLGYPRLEWTVATWNASTISFYEAMGARHLHDQLVYRLSDDALRRVAAGT